jgi:hypothetical protein
MVALSELDKSRVYFHLGMGSRAGVDAGDLAEVEQACSTVPDDYTHGRIRQQLDLCDDAWNKKGLGGEGRFTTREIYQGDLNRAILRESAGDNRVWKEEYLEESRELAQLLWVPNYREAGMDRFRFTRATGAFINIIPGVADTSVSSRRLEFNQLGGSFGF